MMKTPFAKAISDLLVPLGFSRYGNLGTSLVAKHWVVDVIDDRVTIYPIDDNPNYEIIFIDLNDPQSLDKILQTVNG